MKTRVLIACLALPAASVFSGLAPAATGDTPARAASKAAKAINPQALATYKSAQTLTAKIAQERSVLDTLHGDSATLGAQARALSAQLKEASRAAQERDTALAQLPAMLDATLKSRATALAATGAYQHAADDALKAIEAFAGADEKAAEAKSRLAGAAADKKAELRDKALSAASEASASERQLGQLLYRVTSAGNTFKRQTAGAIESGNKIIALGDGLTKSINSQRPDLALALGGPLAQARDRTQGVLKQLVELQRADDAAYRQLLTELSDLQGKGNSRSLAIRAYLEAGVQAVVKNEAYAFAKALRDAGRADPAIEDEWKSAAAVQKTALAQADTARGVVEAQDRASQSFMAGLPARTSQLPNETPVIASSITESSLAESAFGVAEGKLQAALEAKNAEYQAAVRAEEKAFAQAYGYPSQRMFKAAAAPQMDSQMSMEAMAAGAPMDLREHVYAQVNALDGEPKGYGAYTYVLFRQGMEDAQDHVKARYKALLTAIYRSTTEAKKFTANIPKDKLNVFCIPSARSASGADAYDADLARSYLATAGNGAILRKDIMSRIRLSPGPFMLTTRTRLSVGGAKTELLFVDLSDYPADAFDAILAEYKNTLVEHPPAGQEVWTPRAAQQLTYVAISASSALPKLLESIKKIVDLFVPSAEAKPK